ncbi:MAG: hypothetical protein H0V89_10025 [Deltaproteobacteria bacterium]|nr:hypothetical protein [Deltaproteobacteria bacterium]
MIFLCAAALALDPSLVPYRPLVGHWTRGESSETWVEVGDFLYGVGFVEGPDGTAFEVMRLLPGADGVTFVAMPGGLDPVAFRADGWTFSAPEHDFPKWIRYERKGERLRAEIGDTDRSMGWKFRLEALSPDEGLVRADRAFAAGSAGRGISAWTEAFASDGWMWRESKIPAAQVAEAMSGLLAAGELDWDPVAAGLSPDGSLGFTIGTSTFTPTGGAAQEGAYVTIWRRAPEGMWRVLFDTGD